MEEKFMEELCTESSNFSLFLCLFHNCLFCIFKQFFCQSKRWWFPFKSFGLMNF